MPAQSQSRPRTRPLESADPALFRAAVLARNAIAGYVVEGDPIPWRYVLRELNAAIAKVNGPGG